MSTILRITTIMTLPMMNHIDDQNNIGDDCHHCDDEVEIQLAEFRFLHSLDRRCKSIRAAVAMLTVIVVAIATAIAMVTGMTMLKNAYCAILIGATGLGSVRLQIRCRNSSGLEDSRPGSPVRRTRSEHQPERRLCA